jgi:hypothetical protein
MLTHPADWVRANLSGVRPRGASLEADCPACGKSGHLYVHGEKGYFTCFAKNCGFSGRNLIPLIAKVEGITESEARTRYFRGVVEFTQSRPKSVDGIHGRLCELRNRVKGGAIVEKPAVDVAPPRSMISVWDGARWRMPSYLLERGISRRLARAYGIGFCGDDLCDRAPGACAFVRKTCVELGRCRYAGRIVLPFSCPNGRSFTARATDPQEGLRYLNPPSPKGRLLYGFQSALVGGELVVVEGPFDSLKLAAHGIPSVALMGLSMTTTQRGLLAQLQLTAVTLMLDAGVESDALKIAASLVGVAREVFIARLPGTLDPGETTREQAFLSLREAEPFIGARSSLASSHLRRLSARKKELDIYER